MTTFYPLDTVRYRLQVEDPEKRQALSTFKLLKQLMTEEGFESLYCGIVPVLQSLCISNFVYFYTFHCLKAIRNRLTKSPSTQVGDLLIGMIAGAVNVLTTTPVWVVNTRLKMFVKSTSDNSRLNGSEQAVERPYNNLIQGLWYILRTEGVQGLWSGALPSLMLISNPALQFMAYESLKRRFVHIPAQTSAVKYFLIGAMAKMFATVLTYPLQLVQTQQRHGKEKPGDGANGAKPTMTQIFVRIWSKYGIKGVFRGLEAKLMQTVMTAALMFMIYEKTVKFVLSLLLQKRAGGSLKGR